MSYYIENYTWVPIQSTKESINRKTKTGHDTFHTEMTNDLKLHEKIKDEDIIQDKAILPKIFAIKYNEIQEIINKNITKNNIELVNKLIEKKKSLEGIHKELNDNKLDKLYDTFSPNKNLFEIYDNTGNNTVINPLNKIIENWDFDPSNLYESSYTYLWDKIFSKGIGLDIYGCGEGSPSPRKVAMEDYKTIPQDLSKAGKKIQVGFQKDYKSQCSSFMSSLNNIICSRVINLHQPSFGPIYNSSQKSLTGFIVKNLLFGDSRTGNIGSILPFFKNIKLKSDIIFPSYLSGSFVTIKLNKQIIYKFTGEKHKHNRRHILKTISIPNLHGSNIFNSLIQYDSKTISNINNTDKLVEYIIQPFGSASHELFKKYPLNIVDNPSINDYSINDILEDITILYNIYCEKKSLDWFLTNRKLADTGNDTTTLNRKIARELLYLSLLNLILYVKECFRRIKEELEKSSESDNLKKNINLTLDNIINIMYFNAGELFGFRKVSSFVKKTTDTAWPGCVEGDINIISSEKKQIWRLVPEAFNHPLDDPDKFEKRFPLNFKSDDSFKVIIKDKKFEHYSGESKKSEISFKYYGIFVTKTKKEMGSYDNYFIENNDGLIIQKPIYYINTSDNYKESTLQFTNFLVGTSGLAKFSGRLSKSLGLFDSINNKKNKLVMDVFVQFAKNNRLQINKLIKYIDYFLRNYLTKMPLKYVKELKERFEDSLDIVIKESQGKKKRLSTDNLVKEYSNLYESYITDFADTLINYIRLRYKIKMENANINDVDEFENTEYKLIIIRNKILFFTKILRIIYEQKVNVESGKNKGRIKQTKKYDMPSRIINEMTVKFKKAKDKIEGELRKKTNIRDISLKIGDKYDILQLFRKLLSDETDVSKYIYKRDLKINVLKPPGTADNIREQANAKLIRNTLTGCRITGDRLLSIEKLRGKHIILRNRYMDEPDKYLADANKQWDSDVFYGIDPFATIEHTSIYIPLVDYNFGDFGRALLDLRKWLKVSNGNSADYKNFSDCVINVKKFTQIRGLVLVTSLSKNITDISRWRVMSSRKLKLVHEKTKLNMNRRYRFVINLLTNPETYKMEFKNLWPLTSSLMSLLIKKCFKYKKNGTVSQVKCEKIVAFNCLATRLNEIFDSF
jgi:hypothetical protein